MVAKNIKKLNHAFTSKSWGEMFSNFVRQFESVVLCDKKKLTEYEKLLLQAGAAFAIDAISKAVAAAKSEEGLEYSRDLVEQLKHESYLFKIGPLHQHHKFFDGEKNEMPKTS